MSVRCPPKQTQRTPAWQYSEFAKSTTVTPGSNPSSILGDIPGTPKVSLKSIPGTILGSIPGSDELAPKLPSRLMHDGKIGKYVLSSRVLVLFFPFIFVLQLYQHITLSGGSTMFPGLPSRVRGCKRKRVIESLTEKPHFSITIAS